jgi:hypothetical protein
MIVLDGQSALSPFRLERLNGELARIAPGSQRALDADQRGSTRMTEKFTCFSDPRNPR